jgi:hypothetical protein
MRATAAVTAVASMILALVVSGTPASAGWCAEGGSDEHYKSCGFATFEQCQQFVFGIGGLCYRDPLGFRCSPTGASLQGRSG